jgi:hypothetical protein
VFTPTVDALSSSSRMAIRPIPNFVRRIRHAAATATRSSAKRA